MAGGSAARKLGPSAKQAGNRGLGRKKGIPNKFTGQVKEMILAALDNAGGVDYLTGQAKDNPSAFLTLVGKVLPLQLTGENGGAILTAVDLSGLGPDQIKALANVRIPADR